MTMKNALSKAWLTALTGLPLLGSPAKALENFILPQSVRQDGAIPVQWPGRRFDGPFAPLEEFFRQILPLPPMPSRHYRLIPPPPPLQHCPTGRLDLAHPHNGFYECNFNAAPNDVPSPQPDNVPQPQYDGEPTVIPAPDLAPPPPASQNQAMDNAPAAPNEIAGQEHAAAIVESCIGHWDNSSRCATDIAIAANGLTRNYAEALRAGGKTSQIDDITNACAIKVTEEERRLSDQSQDTVARIRVQRADELRICWNTIVQVSHATGVKPTKLQARLIDTSRTCLQDDAENMSRCTDLENELRSLVPQ